MAKEKETHLETAKTYIGRAVASKFPVFFCVAFAFLVATGHILSAFNWLDLRHSDILFRQRGMSPGDPRITIVEIDDDSIEKVGQFPWPRRVYKRDRKSTRLNSSHIQKSRMPSSA